MGNVPPEHLHTILYPHSEFLSDLCLGVEYLKRAYGPTGTSLLTKKLRALNRVSHDEYDFSVCN
jgi:hypothetical protein